MRSIIFHLLFLLPCMVKAQNFTIQPLACGVWGKENWSTYTETDLQRKSYPGPVDLEQYNRYKPSNDVSFLAEDQYGYINNLQCIRWSLEQDAVPYKVTVKENGKRVILSQAVTTGCGLILFPDSLMKFKTSTLEVTVEQEGYYPMHYSFKAIHKKERSELMDQLLTCADIHSQVGILLKNEKYREALSLLEIEKLRNPGDPDLDNLYWRTASRIRFCPLVFRDENPFSLSINNVPLIY
ncbi:MAG: hypothetical protein JWM14_2250 [Chitinophagaceae bacterium]|nr:hypothetical protein [Chitinophagaceae bacterium]